MLLFTLKMPRPKTQQRPSFRFIGRRILIIMGIGRKSNIKSEDILHAVAKIM
jgi:hypothetical protein